MIVLLSLLIITLFAFISAANRWKGELQVEGYDIRGHRGLSETDIIVLANVAIGSSLYEVDLMEVRRRVRAHPYVRDAVVSHDLPSTIKITIQERVPVAILGGPELFSLTGEGYVLPSMNSPVVFDLPVLTGLSQLGPIRAGMRCETENLKAALRIFKEAASFHPELYHSISEINLAGADPILYTAEHGIPILFGREKIRTQLAYLQSFWNQYVRQQGMEQITSIDLRFENEIIVRWTKRPGQEKS